MLALTDMTVGEIAYRLGFSEATNLAKFLHRGCGHSPAEFRARTQRLFHGG